MKGHRDYSKLPKKGKPKTEFISIRMSKKMIKDLDKVCKEHDISKGVLVRAAMEDVINELL